MGTCLCGSDWSDHTCHFVFRVTSREPNPPVAPEQRAPPAADAWVAPKVRTRINKIRSRLSQEDEKESQRACRPPWEDLDDDIVAKLAEADAASAAAVNAMASGMLDCPRAVRPRASTKAGYAAAARAGNVANARAAVPDLGPLPSARDRLGGAFRAGAVQRLLPTPRTAR